MKTKSGYGYAISQSGDVSAGNLNKYVSLQSKTITRNNYGEEVITWSTYAQVWAAIRPLRGKELYESSQTQSEVTGKIIMRYRTDVKPYDQIVFGSRTFEIIAVINPVASNKSLELMVRELVR